MGIVLMESYTTQTGEWVGGELPTHINATQVVTYTVNDIVQQILEERNGADETLEVTLDDVLERVYKYAESDFACEWGHTSELTNVVFTDNEGSPV